MRKFFFGLVFVTAISAFAKSSEIPDRREFPVNPEINPCQDFYKYACSKVDDSFQLRDDRSRHDFAFNDSSERLLDAKKKYFAGLATATTTNPREAMVKTFYSACMNASSRKSEEQKLVKETREKIRGIAERSELLDLLAKRRLTGEDAPIAVDTENNQDKPTYNDVVLMTRWMSLPEKNYYEKPEITGDLEKVVTKLFQVIGESDAAKKAKVVVDFEKGQAKEYLTPNEFREIIATRTGITKAELLKQYPNLRFADLLDKVPESTHIRHIMPKAMDHMNAQLNDLPLEDLKTIVIYEALRGELDDAYPDYFNDKFKFENKHFGGPAVRPDRAERCTRDAMTKFLPEVDSVLWTRIFPNFPREKIVALSEKIRTSIVAALKDNKWLSPAARKEAMKKITTANLQLVAPQTDEEWDFRPMGSYSENQPLANTTQFRRLMIEKDLNELKGPISSKRWGMGPLTINAYYNEAYNKFVLPVGILQYPFYDVSGPLEINLGAVGTVIGHELGHGIDDKGSRFDSKGLLRSWMTPADLKAFKTRTAILIEQFNKAGMNGEFTLGENIGDLVGLTASHYAAFGPGYKEGNKDMERAFFTQYARAWCEVQRPKYAEARVKLDPHSLSVARVNEQVRQQVNFAKAFSCKDTDAMVLPKDKMVKIW